MTCTWVDCARPAAHLFKTDGGQVWARLCDEHDAELARELVDPDEFFVLNTFGLFRICREN